MASEFTYRNILLTCAILLGINGILTSQCSLSNLTIENTECNASDLVDVVIDFDFENEGNQGFTVLGNGTNYGNFQYSALPISLPNINANCETSYEFIVRDVQSPACAVFSDYGTICCEDACLLEILSVETSECTDDTYTLTVVIDEAVLPIALNIAINGSIIQVNAENDTLIITDIESDNIGLSTLIVCEADNPECFAETTFLNPCVCSTTNITSEIIDCNEADSSYYALINFDFAGVSDSFQLGYSEGGNNNFLGVFAYSDLPITAGPIFWSDNEREILLVDKNDFFCFSPVYLGVVNDCNIQCQIFNVFAESMECENGQFFMDVEFDTEDIEGYTFDVIVDDINYGSFVYGESFYSVGPINQNCDAPPVVVIQDSDNEACSDFFNFDDPICCAADCEFTTFEVTAVCNDASEVVLTIEYENPSTTSNNEIFISFMEEYGPFSGPSGTVQISIPLLADGVYEIEIYVAGNIECSALTDFTVLCPEEECIISTIQVLNVECEMGEVVNFDFLFFFADNASDSFLLINDDIVYATYAYNDLPYTVNQNFGQETVLTITDSQNPNCTADFPVSFNCIVTPPECEYGDMEIALLDCIDDTYSITIDFDYVDPNSENFTLSYGNIDSIISYESLPFELSGLPIDSTITITATSLDACTTTSDTYLQSCLDNVYDSDLETVSIYSFDRTITIRNPSAKTFNYQISHINGSSISNDNISSNSDISINANHLKTGVYIVSVWSSYDIKSQKIVIIE